MTNENLDAINLTSSGSTCSSSSSSAASSASNCSPNSTLNNSFNVTNNNNNSSQQLVMNNNNKTSQQQILSQQVDEMAVNFGLIMKDLKSVSTTLNLLARQIDQVVNKMDSKFNVIIKAIDLNGSGGGGGTVNNTMDESGEESKKVIKVVNSNSNASNCNKKAMAATSVAAASACTTFLASNSPNSQHVNSKCMNNGNLSTQTPSKKSNGGPIQQRAYSDRKVVNFSETDPAMFTYPNNGGGKLMTDTLPTSHSHRVASSTNGGGGVAPSSRCNTLNGGASVSIVNGSNNPRIKCTRSKSQPAFKDGNYSYLVANMPMVDLPNKLSVFDSNRYTSSPVSHNNYRDTNDPMSLQQQQTQVITAPSSAQNGCHALLNNNNNGHTAVSNSNNDNGAVVNPTESSFYEDQLDNELESISTPQPNESHIGNGGGNERTNSVMRNGQLSTTRTPRAKSGNHVSFNINNAIYTSRQETPIPISVLKQQQQQQTTTTTTTYGNNSNGYHPAGNNGGSSYHPHLVKASIESNNIIKPILVQQGGNQHDSEIEIQQQPQQGGLVSPTNVNLKKSAGISDLLSQYVHQMSNEKESDQAMRGQQLRPQQQQQQHLNKQQSLLSNLHQSNQPNKVDTKTTIL